MEEVEAVGEVTEEPRVEAVGKAGLCFWESEE